MPLVPLIIVVFCAVLGQEPAPANECAAWAECRDAALAAEARQDFERFHDLAWRTIQKGPRNNPELMLMLARAQSSSGRPSDALVMLRRIADMGVAVDASAEGFARVRSLPGWDDLEPRFAAGEKSASIVESSPPRPPAPPAAEPSSKAASAGNETVRSAPEATAVPPPSAVGETLRFTTPAFTPGGLAYDAVSRRFIVGDTQARKLTVVDEFSHHIANLAGSQATGFGEIAALEIDPREGNLWVVTADAASESAGQTTLHKLQLISARALAAFRPPDSAGAARLTDVAVTSQGTVLALDALGQRVFRLKPRGKALEVAVSLDELAPLSIAPAPDDVVYISHPAGIRRVVLGSGTATDVAAGPDVSIEGITRIRWYASALVGIQRTASGGHRAVRLTLSRNGRRVTSVEVLDPSIEAASPAAACISGEGLYYLAPGAGGEMVVRRVALEPPPTGLPVTH